MESILTSIKKLLGIAEEYEHFDADIIMHINSAFMALTQIGVGPTKGFSIKDKTSSWDDFVADPTKFEAVKTYVYLKVRLVFDPPTNSTVIAAFEKQLAEWEFRINVAAESE